jgi:hypothetical protein
MRHAQAMALQPAVLSLCHPTNSNNCSFGPLG